MSKWEQVNRITGQKMRQTLKTDCQKSESEVTGHFAYMLGPSYLQRSVEYEGGKYEKVDQVNPQRTGW